MVLAEGAGAEPDARVASIGPALVFERLWQETGCRDTIRSLLAGRRHRFDVERAVFMTVLHRLTVSGSDRSAMRWRRDQDIEGVDGLDLHHMYRAMGWLGEPLDASESCGPAPRRTKDLVEEALFARRRDLFTDLTRPLRAIRRARPSPMIRPRDDRRLDRNSHSPFQAEDSP